MEQKAAKKKIIDKYSDTKLRNNFPDDIAEKITKVRNGAFANEINKGEGDFVGALEEIEGYLEGRLYLENMISEMEEMEMEGE